MLVQLQAFHSFFQIKLIEVIKSHEVSISTEDIHFIVVDWDTLAIASTRFLADDVSVAVVIDDLLFYLFLAWLLVSDRL